MTELQFNEIKERLAKWREDRHLTYENQKEGFLGNVFEEVSEYFIAKDDLERIDALCDIAVLYFNAFDIEYEYDFDGNSRMGLLIYLNSCLIDNKNSLALDNEVIYGMSRISYNKIVSYILSNIYKQVSDLGFNFYKCMLETIKEIESRTGKYDKDIGKFVKDIGAYTYKEAKNKFLLSFKYKEDKDFWYFITLSGIKKIKKWYKADYESCRID